LLISRNTIELLVGNRANMERPNERTSFDDVNNFQRDSSSERSPHSVDVDEEKFLLMNEGHESTRNGSRRNRWSWCTRVQTAVTTFNIVLFSISVIILSTTRGGKIISDQDYWRATSYYCTSPLLTPVTHQTTDAHRSPSLRPSHYPQTHTQHKRHVLGHRTTLHLARPNRRGRRRSLGVCRQQHHAHRHNFCRCPRARQRPRNRRQSTSRTQLRRRRICRRYGCVPSPTLP
jgi:hypothetical protein